MYHSTSFCAAGSAILLLMSVASWVFALRARSMASFTSARSPVSGATVSLTASLGAGEAFDGFALRCAEACLACRFFSDTALRRGRASLPACDFLVVSCAFWVFGLWLRRRISSVVDRAVPASEKKEVGERKDRFMSWSAGEARVTK